MLAPYQAKIMPTPKAIKNKCLMVFGGVLCTNVVRIMLDCGACYFYSLIQYLKTNSYKLNI